MRLPETHPPAAGAAGFSLVEMLVALMFTSILMSGMAMVFKANLGNLVASAEATSGRRQNRLALEGLFDDLNNTGMTPSSLTSAPASPTVNLGAWSTSNVPPFNIVPNQPWKTGDSTFLGDQLYLYFDSFLPYTTTLANRMNGTSEDVANGQTTGNALTTATGGLSLQFNTAAQATAAASDFSTAGAKGMSLSMVCQATGQSLPVSSLTASGSTCSVAFSGTPTSITGAPAGSTVNLTIPAQYVRYSIQPVQLTPGSTAQTPCLVRDMLVYPDTATPVTTTIVAENVTGFHVGLSVNGGASWAGMASASAWSTDTTSWPNTNASTNKTALNNQLAALNAAASPAQSVAQGGPFWFRAYPTLVRIDIQTRSQNQRTEYYTQPLVNGTPVAAYKYANQTLVILPRNFGLPY